MYGIYSIQYDNWTKYYDPNNVELELLRQICDFSNKTILDVGCGTGRLSFKIAPLAKKVVGVDIDEYSIAFCNEKKKLNNVSNCVFENRDAVNFTSDLKFDIICFGWSLYQMEMEQVIKNLLPLLATDGVLIIIQPIGGMQEEIFDVEYKKYKTPYDEIYQKQIDICKKFFNLCNEYRIDTCFEYPSIDDAIMSNLFFYELFNKGALKCKDTLINSLRSKLEYYYQNNLLILSDSAQIILCKGVTTYEI